MSYISVFFFQAEDGIRDISVWLEFRRVLFRSPPGDDDALSNVIEKVLASTDLEISMKNGAMKLFHEKLDADSIYDKYAAFVDKTAKKILDPA